MSKFGLTAVDNTEDKPKLIKAPPKRDLIVGIVEENLKQVKVGDLIYDMTDDSMNLERGDRVYIRKSNTVIYKNVKDSELQRTLYSNYRKGLKVNGFPFTGKFKVTHILYGTKKVKL